MNLKKLASNVGIWLAVAIVFSPVIAVILSARMETETVLAPKDYVIVCGTSEKMWFKEWKQEFFTTTNKIVVKTNTGETYTVDAICSVITAVDKGI